MKNKRLIGLDCLRGLAALTVLVLHFSVRFKQLFPDVPAVDFGLDFGLALNAVQLFFAISGFVIFMTLERIEKPLDFIKARFFRLYPTFWAAVIITYTWLLFFDLPGQEVPFGHFIVNFTMIPQFFSGPEQKILSVDGAYWTLQVEFFFYALMLAVLLTRSKQRIEWVMVGLLAWSFAYQPITYRFVPTTLQFVVAKLATITLVEYAPYFAIGIFAYKLNIEPQQKKKYLALLFFAVMIIFAKQKAVTLAPLIITGLIALAPRIQNLPTVLSPLAFAGTISYSLYLVHQNFGYVILREMGLRGYNVNLAFAVACITSILLGTALCFGVERPVMVLSKRFTARKKAAQAIA